MTPLPSLSTRPPRQHVSDERVRLIRALAAHGQQQKDIAAVLGVSRSYVSFVVNGKRRTRSKGDQS